MLHRARVSSIAGIMPGQKNDPSARDIIIEVPREAEVERCSAIAPIMSSLLPLAADICRRVLFKTRSASPSFCKG